MSESREIQTAGHGHLQGSGHPQLAQHPNACVPCLSLRTPCWSNEFLHAHSFIVWNMMALPEKQRYGSIENQLKATLDKSVADQAFYHAVHDLLATDEIQATRLPEEVRSTIVENFKQLHTTAWPKLMYLVQAEMEARIVDPRNLLTMCLNNQVVHIARQVEVPMGDHFESFRVIQFSFMRRGRWFLGYSPGTFIFQYSNTLPFTEELNTMPSITKFRYEGQVPRSSYEHKLRLMVLWKPASELFLGTIALFFGRRHRDFYPSLEFLRSRAVMVPDAFRQILEVWETCNHNWEAFTNQDTRDSIWKHVVTQELAWLILRLKDVPEVYESVQSPDLENLLMTATGLSLQDLAGRWVFQLETMAWQHFFSGNRGELFIYENQGQSVSLRPSSTVHSSTICIGNSIWSEFSQ
ncbi:ring finger [Fusarium sp. NRRL 52700]|nr:ring finger [Fusarium sp. NRRL 52700]